MIFCNRTLSKCDELLELKDFSQYLVAVVIAFIICYAPFHVQRLITSSLNVDYLSLFQRRAITIFYFISGIFYYLGSTINPIFYHLFSRKYREVCKRTVKRILQCQHHRPHQYFHQNRNSFHRPNQSRPVARLVLCATTPRIILNKTKSIEINYRLPNKYNTNLDTGNEKLHISRFSLPKLDIEPVQL